MARRAHGRLILWEGGALWVLDVHAQPPARRRTDFHAHHALQVTLALCGEFTLHTKSESIPHRADQFNRHLSSGTAGQPDHAVLLKAEGKIGRGISEQQAMADALAEGAFASLRWTLVRAGVNAKGRHERPVASTDWGSGQNSWLPVSYVAMGRWMLEEAVANRFIRVAPLVSRARV
jgi:hypothetical protein